MPGIELDWSPTPDSDWSISQVVSELYVYIDYSQRNEIPQSILLLLRVNQQPIVSLRPELNLHVHLVVATLHRRQLNKRSTSETSHLSMYYNVIII